MTRTKTIIGALALCVLLICALAGASASASPGLTAVECVKQGAGSNFSTSECATPTEEGNFETVAIANGVKTNVTASTTGGQPVALRIRPIFGTHFTVVCENDELVGATVENSEPKAGEHKIVGTATRETYLNCHAVLESKESRYCAVQGITAPGGAGMISTRELKGETTNVEHKILVVPAPEAGGEFTSFQVLSKGKNPKTENECWTTSTINVVIKGGVEGEVDTTNHAHLTFTEANNGEGLNGTGLTVKYIDTTGGISASTGAVIGAQTFT
jgi:hypothetical protein